MKLQLGNVLLLTFLFYDAFAIDESGVTAIPPPEEHYAEIYEKEHHDLLRLPSMHQEEIKPPIAVEEQPTSVIRNRRASAATDKAYDEYFDRLRSHSLQIEQKQYQAMMARQAAERQKFAETYKQFHSPTRSTVPDWSEESSDGARPAQPFGRIHTDDGGKFKKEIHEDLETVSMNDDKHAGGRPLPTNFEPMCTRFAVSARLHCKGGTGGKHTRRCWHYFKDCATYMPLDDPLYTMAQIYRTMPEPAAPPTVAHPVESDPPSSEVPDRPTVSATRVKAACARVLPTARAHCHGEKTAADLRRSCWAFLRDCAPLIPSSDPLHRLSQAALLADAPPRVVPPEIPPGGGGPGSPAAAVDRPDGSLALSSDAVEILHKQCDRFLPTIRKHCKGEATADRYKGRCKAYFQDCQRFFSTPADPLYTIAHSFDSGVGLNLGSWAVKGIPYYPINEEGAIGSGRLMNIPFGAWGGGYSDHIGVRDYWSQYQEIGANWYEGKYGYKAGWSVPLVQSLGIEGDTHAVVSVPLKPGEFGKPIGVDVGGGVGPYYQQNHHVGVDWMNGQVNNNFGVGVPIAGVGFNTGTAVAFPGPATWLG